MEEVIENIIGQKITKVIYTELNHQNDNFHFDGFDTFDTSINVKMQSGFWWHLSWKDDEFFEFGKEEYLKNQNYNDSEIKSRNSTERWNSVLNKKVIDFKIKYFDEEKLFLERIDLFFENQERKSILILEELNSDKLIPKPLQFDLGGEIYVFHDLKLIE